MIKFDDKEITEDLYNTTIEGQSKTHSFYKVSSGSAKIHVTGKNCICISYGLNTSDGFEYHCQTKSIGYYKDISDFTESLVSSEEPDSCFKYVSDEEEANSIIEDIKNSAKTRFL